MATLRRVNEQFRGRDHQGAHELFMYLLNDVSETLTKEKKAQNERSAACRPTNGLSEESSSASNESVVISNLVNEMFGGKLTCKVRCLITLDLQNFLIII